MPLCKHLLSSARDKVVIIDQVEKDVYFGTALRGVGRIQVPLDGFSRAKQPQLACGSIKQDNR